MKKNLKIGLFGFLSWLIPFILASIFYSRGIQPFSTLILFKSFRIVVAAIVYGALLSLYFKKINKHLLTEGIVIGAIWFSINIVLDLIILLPLLLIPIWGMSLGSYFGEIGIRYLIIPIMSLAIVYAKKK
ncbi:MAG: hypothetical protein KKA65_04365 [Nanoarchaeota archaeon]|nr:hypothetical protein [Nanoarchaeota archaeon]MBU4242506.1 hypothetical protein [Nanoarchaeota archaeon]MBU4351692.1 hypothetical protein [Nanoarchaeota archaeon]MBU4456709.1 hypothetical protein [Nanoarchaeota archaeon]MCG2719362.1 hypothetical protein [Nanoarchaeota archaeon]